MSKLFNFSKSPQQAVPDKNSAAKIVNNINPLESKSDTLVPVDSKHIDIVKDFKWTKTSRNSQGRANTPTIELEEFYVTVPAFFSNLNIVQQVLQTAGSGALNAIKGIAKETGFGLESITKYIEEPGEKLATAVDNLYKEGMKAFDAEDLSLPQYLRAYELLYGVKRSRFKYKLPYLQDKYKEISNNWGGGGDTVRQFMGAGFEMMEKLASGIAPGVGVDYSKSFQYSEEGPEHTIKFYLDNTFDSDYTGDSVTVDEFLGIGNRRAMQNYETNFRFVYLLLYQNLPNRINKVTFVPPVIYSAKLPGVFSYRYCYFRNISVNMVGVRKTKTIPDFINGQPSPAVIPEGYEIEMTLQSLVPETQNLYYDAMNSAVVSTEE